jgi:hypothetical protein
MPTTFIGDVHGWPDRLERVLAQAEGEVVLLGDLVDRGPDVPQVLAMVRDLVRSGRGSCLMGNHEYALLRGLGAPSIRLADDADWFETWASVYGGEAVLDAFGARNAPQLRQAMGEDTIAWLADLPWILQGCEDGRRWTAVHAGMHPGSPFRAQVDHMLAGWDACGDHPFHLYDKQHVRLSPGDMPPDMVLVSGHTPVPEPIITARRILCDTSGGRPNRKLSAVIWPAGRVVTS